MKPNQPNAQQPENSARQQQMQSPTNNAANQQQYPKREIQISQSTRERAEACKAYIERKYSKMKQEEAEKREAWEQLHIKMDDLNMSSTEQELVKRDILHKESERYRQKRKPITVKDFDPIAIIGRGAFGEVRVCRYKETNEIVAMKKMNKSEMIYKNQVAHVRAEKEVLAAAANPWIVELKFSFQDDKYLYLVMEYLPGGDLMTLLMKKDILSEDEAKFYIAEAILAVESVHKLNYIHRDLKPDNILLDSKGHIKLSDFGLCKHTEIKPRRFEFQKKAEEPQPIDPALAKGILHKKPVNYKRNRQLAYSTVGTPDYIAPEVFGHNGYTETVDWWSLGVILFEMLVGYPPFFSEDPSMTCQKILHWRKTLVIPPEANLNPASVDLLKRMITDSNERLGVNGVEEIKIHPFFAGVDWKRIRDKKAPNIPELQSDIDTSNFDKFEEEEPWYTEDTGKRRTRKDANFIGYTFKRDAEAQRSHLVTALQDLETNRMSQARVNTQSLTQQQQQPPVSPLNNPISIKSPGLANVQQNVSNNNISSALGSIANMNHSHTNFPNFSSNNSSTSGGSTNNSTTQQSKVGGYTSNYDSSQSQPQNSAPSYTPVYNAGSKSPTVANTNKYAQYIPREIPLRSNNVAVTARQDNNSGGYASNDPGFKKKDINTTTNNPEMNFVMKNKFTPTNNAAITAGGAGKTFAPTTQLKKAPEGYTSGIKPASKPGVSQPMSSKPMGGK